MTEILIKHPGGGVVGGDGAEGEEEEFEESKPRKQPSEAAAPQAVERESGPVTAEQRPVRNESPGATGGPDSAGPAGAALRAAKFVLVKRPTDADDGRTPATSSSSSSSVAREVHKAESEVLEEPPRKKKKKSEEEDRANEVREEKKAEEEKKEEEEEEGGQAKEEEEKAERIGGGGLGKSKKFNKPVGCHLIRVTDISSCFT